MNKSLLLLAAALVAPATAASIWMLILSSQPLADSEDRKPDATGKSLTDSSRQDSQQAPVASMRTRLADPDFLDRDRNETPVDAVHEKPQLAARFTPEGHPQAVLPRRDAVNGLGLQPTERVRILPPGTDEATSAGPVILAVDRGLHDPAAWIESDTPQTDAQMVVKAGIADSFASEIATAARSGGAATVGIDAEWRRAKAKADADYRKMFGDAAFNRASVNGARAAASAR